VGSLNRRLSPTKVAPFVGRSVESAVASFDQKQVQWQANLARVAP
jgi:hypothetical protein